MALALSSTLTTTLPPRILADQLRSLDWNARTVELIGSLSETLVEETLARSRSLLA
jgi:mRNA-degrading endonuclease toxin of MazEF toxin-antitoxin module